MSVGEEIKRIRELNNLSVRKMASYIGVDAERMRKWESLNVNPRDADASRIEAYFEVPISDLYKIKKIKSSKLIPFQENDNNSQVIVTESKKYIDRRRDLKNNKEYVVPFYDAGATAGNEITNTETAITDPVGVISVGHFLSDAEAAIRIYGNSMMSNYPPGCIIGISELKERIIQPGEVYVIETEEQRIFKRIFFKDDNPDSDIIMCYSDNTMLFDGGARSGKAAYPPFYVPLKNIRKINVVLGVIKRNSNLLIK